MLKPLEPRMAQKRQAECELLRQSKRLQASKISDDRDVDYCDGDSDDGSLSPYCISEQSDGSKHQPTPLTPFSPSSAKYPSDLKTHVCPYENCEKAFNRPARLAEHIRSHTNERLFRCSDEGCDKTFLRASHLKHHVKSAHTAIRDYVCDKEGCGKTFVTGSRLRRHLAAHEGRDKYRCTQYPPCNETFRKHSTLQKHVMMAHLDQKPFPCTHKDPVTGEGCTQAFDTAGHLRAHEGRIHGGSKFVCAECSAKSAAEDPSATESGKQPQVSFPNYALLRAHMASVHPPTCPECNRTCSSARELRRHLEISHGSVPLEERKAYACHYPDCKRSFTKRGNLNVHIRTVHEGEKRFVCGRTDLSTSTKIEGWTGEDSCGKRYGSKLALEEHIRTAHLGLQNAKAARREKLGISSTRQDIKRRGQLSNLALLTGEGYAEESGRHIPCLLEGCAYRFHREYDLWLHMASKHGLERNDIQILFMQRAMGGGDQTFDLDFNTGSTFEYGFGDDSGVVEQMDGCNGFIDHELDMPVVSGGNGNEANNDMSLIDPLIAYPEDE